MTESGKTRILFLPEGSILAHVGRAVAIANALDRSLFDISFAASGPHADKIDRGRWPVVAVKTRDRNELLARLKAGGSAFTATELNAYVEDERRVISELAPHVVVGDFRPSLGISATSLKTPYVCVTNAVWTRYCGVELEPPDSWLPTRVFGAPALKRLRALAPSFERRIFAHYASPFNKVRRRYGLAAQKDVRDCMCSEDFNLVADAEELFPHSKDMPEDRYHYVGPLLWEGNAPVPEWLPKLDRTRPTVYLTMGSTGPLERIQAILLLLARDGFQVICTSATEVLRELPPGCYATRYAPGGAMCEMADVIVCHAGNGTIYQALSHGKPIVGIPEFHDQEFNVQRAKALGVGLSARLEDKEEVIRQVHAVLDDPSFSRKARDFQKVLRQERWKGPVNAARCIEKFTSK